MTPESQRIAIAEACGWKYLRLVHRKGHEWWFAAPEILDTYLPEVIFDKPKGEWNGDIIGGMKALPDYLNDLNAMHDAESLFDAKLLHVKRSYFDWLSSATMPDPFPVDGTHNREYVMVRATAAQRAEAFLRCIGKWEETTTP